MEDDKALNNSCDDELTQAVGEAWKAESEEEHQWEHAVLEAAVTQQAQKIEQEEEEEDTVVQKGYDDSTKAEEVQSFHSSLDTTPEKTQVMEDQVMEEEEPQADQPPKPDFSFSKTESEDVQSFHSSFDKDVEISPEKTRIAEDEEEETQVELSSSTSEKNEKVEVQDDKSVKTFEKFPEFKYSKEGEEKSSGLYQSLPKKQLEQRESEKLQKNALKLRELIQEKILYHEEKKSFQLKQMNEMKKIILKRQIETRDKLNQQNKKEFEIRQQNLLQYEKLRQEKIKRMQEETQAVLNRIREMDQKRRQKDSNRKEIINNSLVF